MRRLSDTGKPVLLVIDGLDEAIDWNELRGIFPSECPPTLRILAAAREVGGQEGDWMAQLRWDGSNAASIRQSVLDEEGVRGAIASTLTALSEVDLDQGGYSLDSGNHNL